MPDAYDDIPDQGTHQGDESHAQENEMTVRGQDPPQPEPGTGETAGPTYQVSYSEGDDAHRVRTLSDDDERSGEEGYEEIGRHASEADLTEALGDLPDAPRFVVFENADTGEVYFDRESALMDSWLSDDRFDQITMFGTETEAAQYAQQREQELNSA